MGATNISGPGVPQTEANPSGGMVPFRRATTFRTNTLPAVSMTFTASQQISEVNVEGTGYIYALDLDVSCVTATNVAVVAFNEDAPWCALASVVYHDTNGELVNLQGFNLYLINIYGGYLRNPRTGSVDTNIYSLVSGGVATGGSFRFHLYLPLGLNRRNLLGILGNQDRAIKYSIKHDLAPSATVYSVAPTNAGTVAISKTYENYAVPASENAKGSRQQRMPNKFGVLNFITQTVNPAAAPLGGSTINHYLPRLGNTIRCLILVFRVNGSRATAEANMPTRMSFKLGDTPIFTESVAYRRALMFERYGFDAPAGVLVYDFMTDILGRAGGELGDDWMFTDGLTNAQFEIVYPTGFGSTNNTLTVVTNDLQIPANVDVYAAD